MIWTSAGSLAVTNGSKNIVGTGTSLASAYPGDALVCAAGVLEIDTVTDNTHIALVNNYPGSTGTLANGTWSILPCSPKRSSVATVADSVSKLIAAYQNLVVATGSSTTITLNKSAAGNNNGLILQDNGTAVARVGTFGDDSLKLQVSNDGSTYVNGITIIKSAGADHGQVSLKAGTAAAPALVLNLDGNTGLFQPVADALGWSIAGAEKMRLHSNGYLGIGVTAPTSPLHIFLGLTDPSAAQSGMSLNISVTATNDNAQQINQLSLNAGNFVVPDGKTLSGGYTGFRTDSFINNSGFAGSMTLQIGLWSRVGILSAAASGARTVTAARGVSIEMRNDVSGATVTNMYGLYIAAASFTGTVTNLYDVYCTDAAALNYFAGKVGIGKTVPVCALDIVYGASGAMAIRLSDGTTNATQKHSQIVLAHYTNAEEPLTLIDGVAGSVDNQVQIGGGNANANAATKINFYTAANNNTLSGTLAAQINSSLQLLLSDGAVGTPALSFISDTNTGIYRAGADILGWVTGGTERGRVNASGHFLLGTTVDNGVLTVGGNIMPEADNTRDLGSTSFRMHTIYAGTGTINTSDAREKSNIVDIRDSSAIVRALVPKSFTKYGEERMGFIAQDVRAVLEKAGIGRDTVKGSEDKCLLGLYAEDLIAPLWASQREVLARLDALEMRRAA